MMLRVALCYMLDEGTVIRKEVRCNVDGLRVPNLAVLQAVLLWVQSRQEAKLCPDAEVGDDDVESLVK